MTSGKIPYSAALGSTVATWSASLRRVGHLQRDAVPASCPRCWWQCCGNLLGSSHEEQFLFIADATCSMSFWSTRYDIFWDPFRKRSRIQRYLDPQGMPVVMLDSLVQTVQRPVDPTGPVLGGAAVTVPSWLWTSV